MAAFYSTPGVPYRTLVCGDTLSRSVTVLAGQGVLRRGQILGKNGTSGKYTKTDQPPSAILADDIDTAAADVQAVVYVQGKFKGNAVVLQDAQTYAAQRDALWDTGVYLDSVMEASGLIVRSIDASQEQFLQEKFEDEPPPPPPVGSQQAMAEGGALVGEEVVARHAEGFPVLNDLQGEIPAASAAEEEDE